MALRILGISGRRQAGKDTLAGMLMKQSAALFPTYRVERIGLADPIKEMMVLRFKCDRGKCFGSEDDKQTPMPFNPSLTYRDAMKKIGLMARELDPEHWCKELCEEAQRYHRYHQNLMILVPDVRFRNEVEYLKLNGGKVLRLTRAPVPDNHPSEQELDGYGQFDAIIDNLNLDPLTTFAHSLAHLIRWGWARGAV